jgi:hypothetical protein
MKYKISGTKKLKVEVKDGEGNDAGSFMATFRVPTMAEFKKNTEDGDLLDNFLLSVEGLELENENGETLSADDAVNFVKTDFILSAATAAALVNYRGNQFRKPK